MVSPERITAEPCTGPRFFVPDTAWPASGYPNLFPTHLSNPARLAFPADKKRPRRNGAFYWLEGPGLFGSVHGPHPSALRAPGTAFDCPNLFPKNLSNELRLTVLPAKQKPPPERGFLFGWGTRIVQPQPNSLIQLPLRGSNLGFCVPKFDPSLAWAKSPPGHARSSLVAHILGRSVRLDRLDAVVARRSR
jgi:hypothetical protein